MAMKLTSIVALALAGSVFGEQQVLASSHQVHTNEPVNITELFSVTLGQAISALTPSTFIAMLLNPFVSVAQ